MLCVFSFPAAATASYIADGANAKEQEKHSNYDVMDVLPLVFSQLRKDIITGAARRYIYIYAMIRFLCLVSSSSPR